MTFYVTDQNTVVLVLAVLGAAFGFLRDMMAVKRQLIPTGYVIEAVEDFIYCAFVTAVYHMAVFVTNYGYVRWYEFASLLTGFVLYRGTAGRYIREAVLFAAIVLKKAVCILLSPITELFVLLNKTIRCIAKRIWKSVYERRLSCFSERIKKEHIEASDCGYLK